MATRTSSLNASLGPTNIRRRHVRIVEDATLGHRLAQQHQRIRRFQRRWGRIKEDLPPQLSRRHIGMISIGGVIGTGLFLGSADALYHAGPVGALLGYSIIGSVVYCLCVSVGEMIAFLPNVGGVVGLADLYVDKALGFSLGWAAWYNWSVTLPAEITAAATLVGFWDQDHTKIKVWQLSMIFIICATGINCFSSRVYGEFEFWFASIKVLTIIVIIVASLLIDLGVSHEGPIGLKYWIHPGPFSQYFGIPGSTGRFLGFWAVLMQASFSFFGSEVPGIAAGEVIDATRNVPRALQRVWIRIVMFYVGGILCAGLLVPSNDCRLERYSADNSFRSPFIIALQIAQVKVLPHILNAAFLLSAWSAAASDVYISSRFLFFLARCHHAPQFLASLIKHPNYQHGLRHQQGDESDDSDDSDDDLPVINICQQDSDTAGDTLATLHRPSHDRLISTSTSYSAADTVVDSSFAAEQVGEPIPATQPTPYLVVPYNAVLCSASVGLLSFLGSMSGSGPQEAFGWLVAVASVASMQSWAGLLFTYIRWHQGTVYAENKHKHHTSDDSLTVLDQIKKIKEHRHWGQPYLAWYAFMICLIVLITNGSAVFIHRNWRIADIPSDPSALSNSSNLLNCTMTGTNVTGSQLEYNQSDPISNFLSSYVPLPFFILLTFGYKLIHRTRMVRLDEMTFSRENVPDEIEPEGEPKNIYEKVMRVII